MRGRGLVLCVVALGLGLPAHARAAFPYPAPAPGADPTDYTQYKLAPGVVPNEIPHDGDAEWKFAASPEAGNLPVNVTPGELGGVRGASVADADPTLPTAFTLTTGRPDVTIATLDSGIRWDQVNAMTDMRRKVRLNRGELPVPAHDRTTALEDGVLCPTFANAYDANGDGVFNVSDYACDARVEKSPASRAARGQPRGAGPATLLDPQDVLIAFSNGDDADGNGYVDDIAGWDFLDDDNDPYDDVHYGHGTGEALDAAAEADNRGADGNGDSVSMCPNCMSLPLRVGDSFVADVDNFAQAAVYATDNGALVIQEALGALNNARVARQAVDYAFNHGVTTIASAADESAQHHNWPSSYAHVIVVNSVRKYTDDEQPHSYLVFNGCTNFSAKVTVAVPSKECSSDATGKGGAMAGLIYSAALTAHEKGKLATAADCHRVDGSACVITPDEVRQVMASGTIDGQSFPDDIDFANQPEPSCSPVPQPSCTNPFQNTTGNYLFTYALSPQQSRRFPSRKGHDQFFGYGRTNMLRTIQNVIAGTIPPEAEIDSPDWFTPVDPRKASFDVRGHVGARGGAYTCVVEVAPGSYPNNGRVSDPAPGDFAPVPSTECDGTTARTATYDGLLAAVSIPALQARFPVNATGFDGREPGIGTAQTSNGRPNIEPYGFVVRVIVTKVAGGKTLTGEDRRNLYLHRDQDLLPDYPVELGSDGTDPLLVDLDGDNRNELVIPSSDGRVHALRPNGTELPGWPVKVDKLPLHTGDPHGAYASGEVDADARGSVLAAPAAADLDRDGVPEVVVADLRGKVYVFGADGQRLWSREANIKFSGKPLTPFADVRQGSRNRTQHAYLGSPVLADLDGDDGGRLEIVAANMDRHVYAYNDDGSTVPGYPELVVDRTKVKAIDPVTNAITFDDVKVPGDLDQGAIIDTPAVGDITGDARPEIVVGTNEEYKAGEGNEPQFNLGKPNAATVAALGGGGIFDPANSRLYALKPGGDADGDVTTGDAVVAGWPFRVGLVLPGVLPVVGEGITGAPIIGPVTCPSGGAGPKVGVIADAGPGYVVNPDATSCYGTDPDNGADVGIQTDTPSGTGRYDTPSFPALGHPAFGDLGDGVSLLAPSLGLTRALDLQGGEYQGGQDFVGAWNAATGQFHPGFPAPVNDLQFLTGPSVADVDGLPGQEVLAATASLDLTALNTAGVPVNTSWPKLTTDWVFAVPIAGSFSSSLDTAADAPGKRVITATRSGLVTAYTTAAPPCSPASWPRFHHDNANSGDYRRDAVAPGRPMALAVAAGTLSWTAPGNDLLCGTATRYEVRSSDSPITDANFAAATPIATTPPAPTAAGTQQSVALGTGAGRYVAVRAFDAAAGAGNVGRAAVLDTSVPVTPTATPTATATAGAVDTATPTATSTPTPSGTASASATPAATVPPAEDVGSLVPAVRKHCVARRLRVLNRGIGRLRLGTRLRARYCVRGGGRVRVTRSRRGRALRIVTTARGHRARGVGRGATLRRLRKAFPRARRVRPHVLRGTSRIAFRVARGRVRAVIVG